MATSKSVSVCLTSCGREDLLNLTLNSFFKFNTYNIDAFYLIDDFGDWDSNRNVKIDELRNLYPTVRWYVNSNRMGQVKSIDFIYNMVKTPYIFHCEDDWEFYDYGFIEKSLEILETQPKCLQVWLREFYDTNGHPILFDEVKGWTLTYNYLNCWHGFSFNPGLRRLKDYQQLGRYSSHTNFNRATPKRSEIEIGNIYKDLGYYSCILDKGYVKHIGGSQHIF